MTGDMMMICENAEHCALARNRVPCTPHAANEFHGKRCWDATCYIECVLYVPTPEEIED